MTLVFNCLQLLAFIDTVCCRAVMLVSRKCCCSIVCPAALHNIPEGLVIAAPLYAATGSKLKALGMTAASGLSEPVGALLALLVFKPFVTSLAQLDYVLAVTGGVMLAVCVLELWPEGRRCGQDVRLMQGIALGTVVMGWTLYVGV
jgi:ZIP family zinc transporter